ncbi:MAG: hypothetical protein D6732_06610 [Methanobacteriota archaeon]|nr:MAG: hypothetical protein D6732_06610 [Euryarchaeota archaeon]
MRKGGAWFTGDIYFLWENGRFRLLLRFDWECTLSTIFRINSEKRENVVEIVADTFPMIQTV